MKDILYEAQSILSRRDNSEAEVRQKLSKKGFSREEIERAIEWLKHKKYLNDEIFARTYTESILRQKAVGPKWIQMKLREKRIASDVIAAVLDDLLNREQERELAQKASDKWKRLHSSKADDMARLGRFLLSRGFSGGIVQEITRK